VADWFFVLLPDAVGCRLPQQSELPPAAAI